jgi:hypothetical protein
MNASSRDETVIKTLTANSTMTSSSLTMQSLTMPTACFSSFQAYCAAGAERRVSMTEAFKENSGEVRS